MRDTIAPDTDIAPPEKGLAHFLPTQTISFADSHGVHSFTLSPMLRLGLVVSGIALAMWGVIATVTVLLASYGEDQTRQRSAALTMAYETRIAELSLERDMLSAQLEKTTDRMGKAQTQLIAQQESLLQIGAERQETGTRIIAIQSQLQAALVDRDSAASNARRLDIELATIQTLMTDRLGGQQDEIAVVTSMTSALADAVQSRDAEQAKVGELQTALDDLELQRSLNGQRQDRMLSQLEDALSVSLVPLSGMFEAAGLDIDSLLANVRQNYSGTGGLSDESAEAMPDFNNRMQDIFGRLEEISSLQAAAARIPFTFPLRSAYRLTSPFGPRGGRLHKGLDLASSLNTPVLATADATVFFSGVQSGFGNLVILDHGGGYKTYYAHLNRTRVTIGQRVARGDLIGDMGNSGRSSGVHVHYEIRKDGVSLNPMTFIKAGRNVY
ncbi:MAG: DUF5930 domain-containing protein [Rhodobacteraceae bacterium]|nr:DUF5930 domain-containing protein [Paracoccaceae bacterium]